MPTHCLRALTLATPLALFGVAQPVAAAQNETIFSFSGQDGRFPAGIITDAAGVIYGTTTLGGTSKNCQYGCGTIFRLIPPTAPGVPWKHQVLYNFQGQTDGGRPTAAPIVDTAGNLYGTTKAGGGEPVGHNPVGAGVVWRLSPNGSGGWEYSVLHTFSFGSGDGAIAEPGVIMGSNGVLYGTTFAGGIHKGGAVYSLTSPSQDGQPWQDKVLFSFSSTTGHPDTTPVLTGHDQTLVGTTYGPTATSSIAYNLKLSENPPRLARRAEFADQFSPGYDGSLQVTISKDHTVVYAAPLGGTENTCGSIQEIAPPTAPGTIPAGTSIYSFGCGSDGSAPSSNLLRTATGSLIGTTENGPSFYGTVFRLDPPAQGSTSWSLATLHQFTGTPGSDTERPDGAYPSGDIVWGYKHRVYGITGLGGRYNRGTVFWQSPF